MDFNQVCLEYALRVRIGPTPKSLYNTWTYKDNIKSLLWKHKILSLDNLNQQNYFEQNASRPWD